MESGSGSLWVLVFVIECDTALPDFTIVYDG